MARHARRHDDAPSILSPNDEHGCYVCGAPVRRRLVGGNEMRVCRSCGTGQVRRTNGVRDYWSAAADPGQALADDYWTRAKGKVFQEVLRRLERSVSPGRLLDVGGGNGHFAKAALDRGWDASSMDVSLPAHEAASTLLGPGRSLTHLPTDDGSWDAITLWCVVAHVPDPLDLLRSVVKLLRPGGVLFVTTPNFSFQARYAAALAVMGRHIDFAAHDHFLHFTPASLDRLLATAGLPRVQRIHAGIAEECVVAPEHARLLLPLKRAWNRGAIRATQLGLPLLVSELQVIATKP